MDDATRTAQPSSPDIAPTELAPSTSRPAPLKYRDRERYELRGEQGRGGLGLVSRAHDRELGRDVAVKELLSRGNTNELRFFREALITSRLEHPGIVPVHEAGRWADGTPFYTMKLVGGRSLHSLIASKRTLEDRLTLLPNVIAVADAIAYAHEQGVIHRDLKPSNVMVGDFGETIVIDWGLAKVLDDTADVEQEALPYRTSARDDLTAAGSVLGTPAYMSPEQYDGESDQRTDIYALGGILHHLLTGRPPHARTGGQTFTEANLRYSRNTPADLIAIAQRALEHDPARRYQTASAFAEELKRYMRRDRVEARRYSIASRLALLFARHRSVALVLVAALVALTVTFGIALIKVRSERAQAVTAQRTAVTAQQTAVINNAAALLERDPTRAWETLKSVPEDASPALLRARIKAAGVADRRIALPGRFDAKQVIEGGNRVVLATAERTLHTLDTRTGELQLIADGLTEPAVWATTEKRVYFVRETPRLALASVSTHGGPVVDIAPLETLPRFMLASDHGAVWLDAEGTLRQADVGAAPSVVAHDIGMFVPFGEQLALCTKTHELFIGSTKIAPCDPDNGAWNFAANAFVYGAGDTLYVHANGHLANVRASDADALQYASVTDTGFVAGIGVKGDGVILRAGANAVEHVQLGGTPLIVQGLGHRAGWAHTDGSVEVIDTDDGRHWSLRASSATPWCFAFLTESRVMTCDRREVRLWTLPDSAPSSTATIPLIANYAVFDAKGNGLLNGADGHGYLIKEGEKSVTAIHAHEGVSFGAAWCDRQACTSGWDGRVLCTDTVTGRTRVAADLHSMTPWLAVGNGHCFTAAASGGVYDLRSPAHPIYVHEHEPYRVAVSEDGKYVASGDWGGDIVVYDTQRQRVSAQVARAHAGRVTNVLWLGEQLITSGADGVLRLWNASLVEQRRWQMRGAIRYLDASSGTIGASLEDGSVWMLSASSTFEQHVSVDAPLTAVDVSPNGKLVAAGTSDGEVVVLSADRRAAAVRFGEGNVSCLSFESDAALAVCALRKRLMRVPVASLSFETSPGTMK